MNRMGSTGIEAILKPKVIPLSLHRVCFSTCCPQVHASVIQLAPLKHDLSMQCLCAEVLLLPQLHNCPVNLPPEALDTAHQRSPLRARLGKHTPCAKAILFPQLHNRPVNLLPEALDTEHQRGPLKDGLGKHTHAGLSKAGTPGACERDPHNTQTS